MLFRPFKACLFAVLFVAPCFTAADLVAQSPELQTSQSADKYEFELFTTGINIPWGMAWLDNDNLLVTDRKGELRLIRHGELLHQPISGLPEVIARSQGGLLDVAIDPDFKQNGWIYFSYAGVEGAGNGANTSIMRAKLKGLSLASQELLFEGSPNTISGKHFGSRLEFDNDGYLFFSIGDRGNRDKYPQNLNYDAGKIHRIRSDGSIPDNNPFTGQSQANDSIYSYGHRNPQGMARHPETGDIWTHEHGPRGGDEINLLRPGANYGWPLVTFGVNYIGTKISDETEKEGMEQPRWVWTPSIAPSDMLFINSDIYPEWQGKIVIGSLKFNYLVLVELNNNDVIGHSKIFEGIGRVRSLAIDPTGFLYVGTDGQGIYKILPKRQDNN